MDNRVPFVSRNNVSIRNTVRPFRFLDFFPDVSATYSLRSLNKDQTDVVRVRRTSDNAEQDFSEIEINDESLVEWVNTDVVTYSSDFSSDNDGWTAIRTILTANTDGIGGENDVLKIQSNDGTAANKQIRQSTGTFSLPSLDFNISFDLYIPSTNTLVDGVGIGDNVTTYDYGTAVVQNFDTWESFSIDFTKDSGSNRLNIIMIDDSHTPKDAVEDADDIAYIKNITYTQKTSNGAIPTWYDQRVATSKSRMYFDGVDDYVDITSSTLGTNWTISAKFLMGDISNNASIIGFDTTNNVDDRIFVNNSTKLLTIRTESTNFILHDEAISQEIVYELNISVSNGVVSGAINGMPLNTSTINSIGPTIFLGGGRSGAPTTFIWTGSIWDVNINDESQYLGYGNQDEDWVDQIGSNDGTVNGNPERISSRDFTTISRDAIQTTATRQPLIVQDGQLVKENGLPSIQFVEANSTFLDIPRFLNDVEDSITLFWTGTFEKLTNRYAMSGPSNLGIFETSSGIGNFAAGGFTSGTQAIRNLGNDIGFSTWTFIRNNNLSRLSGYQNGELRDETNSYSENNISQFSRIGSRNGAGQSPAESFNAKTSEIIMFSSDKSSERLQIEKNTNNYYKIH